MNREVGGGGKQREREEEAQNAGREGGRDRQTTGSNIGI